MSEIIYNLEENFNKIEKEIEEEAIKILQEIDKTKKETGVEIKEINMNLTEISSLPLIEPVKVTENNYQKAHNYGFYKKYRINLIKLINSKYNIKDLKEIFKNFIIIIDINDKFIEEEITDLLIIPIVEKKRKAQKSEIQFIGVSNKTLNSPNTKILKNMYIVGAAIGNEVWPEEVKEIGNEIICVNNLAYEWDELKEKIEKMIKELNKEEMKETKNIIKIIKSN